MPHGILIVPDV